MGEFQTGSVVRWNFNAPLKGSVDLMLANDTDKLLKITVQYDKKYVSFSSPSEDVLGYEEKDMNFPFALSNTSVIVIIMEEDGLAISSNENDFIHRYRYIGVPSGKIIMTTTSGTIAVGKVRHSDCF